MATEPRKMGTFAHKLGASCHGDGDRSLLFLNGFGTEQGVWRHQVEHFRDRYRIVTFDFVGSGASDIDAYAANRYASPHDYVDDVLGLIDELGLKNLAVIGHSFGGTLGALVSIAIPDITERLVMIGAAPRYLTEDGYPGAFSAEDAAAVLGWMVADYQAWVTGFSGQVAAPENPSVAAAFAEYLRSLRPDIAQSSLKTILNSDVRTLMPRVQVPTLLIQAAADLAVPRDIALYLRDAIPGSTLIEIAFAGHLPHMLAPVEITRLIDGFLGQHR